MAYKGMYPVVPGLARELKQSRVIELTPEAWMIEGYISTNFFKKPPSSNCFVLRDGKTVLLIDTGTYPFYRQAILDVLGKCRKDGATKLVLMLTQGHFDHVCNNDVAVEARFSEFTFMLPKVELSTIDLEGHWNREFMQLLEYYDPYKALPAVWPTAVVHYAAAVSTPLAQRILRLTTQRLFRGIETLAERAMVLPNESRVRKTFGDVELLGWEVGRFFAVHDATHSPGHLSFYDPKYKLFLTGDATLEINPPFFNGSMDNCIDMMGKFKRMADQGFVEIATDAHRSSIWANRLQDELKYNPLHRTQTLDMMRGKEECASFYAFFEEYYTGLKRVVLDSLARLGEATVPQLVEEFKASNDPNAKMKTACVFPRLPSRLDILVANVLKEANAPRRKERDQILFSPP